VLAAAVLAASAGMAQAQLPPNAMTYQGRLTEGGVPANGTYSMRFGLFSSGSSTLEIASRTQSAVNVTDGLFTTTIGGFLTDGPSEGVYTSLRDITRDFGLVYLEITVNGVVLENRQLLNSAPFAINAYRATALDDVLIDRDSVWFIENTPPFSISNLTISGSGVNLQIGESPDDALSLSGTMYMLPAGTLDVDQRIFFTNAGSRTAESLIWDDSDDRFEFSDALAANGPLAVAGPLVVGSTANPAGELFSRIGTETPRSSGMNTIEDLFVGDDLEVWSSLIVSGEILMRQNQPDGDAVMAFREGGSDFGKTFRWDDSEDRFVFSDDIRLGESANFELTTVTSGQTLDNVAEIKSTGGISIRVDQDNDESGSSAGVFAVTANNASLLMLLQGTDEANLQLDNGVQADAFDFAEAFRVAPGQESLEPGDVVALSLAPGRSEHCEIADEPSERLLLGVVSTNPAFTAGMSFEELERVAPELTAERDAARARGDAAEVERLETLMTQRLHAQWKPIAQIGRVPTKVDGSRGAIKAGDYLTSSPTPGHAMKLNGPGMTIGVALEDFDEEGKGVISVFVRPMWHGGIGSGMEGGGVAGGGAAVVHTALGTPAAAERLSTLEQENAALRQRLEQIEAMLQQRLTSK
jgi:hypothetical protein